MRFFMCRLSRFLQFCVFFFSASSFGSFNISTIIWKKEATRGAEKKNDSELSE